MSKYPPIHYSEYLQLEKLLGCQERRSEEYGKPVHDEMLFIVVHQSYELWFKQILFEVEAVLDIFQQGSVAEKNIGKAISHITRVIEIQKILIDKFRVLETMTSADFLDFRDYLVPASGFQSVQFRILENALGLERDDSIPYEQTPTFTRLPKHDQEKLNKTIGRPSLFHLVEQWLERTPFLEFGDFNFWHEYRLAVRKMLHHDRDLIETNPILNEKEKKAQMKNWRYTEENFLAIFEEDRHLEMMKNKQRRLSYHAFKAALFINLYRDQPIVHLPFRLLTSLIEVDELFTSWRYRHALLVMRMIGSKIGTGGSSGHHYLMNNAAKHRVFSDLCNLSTFLIPRSALPELPLDIRRNLGFYFTYGPKGDIPQNEKS